MSKANLKTPLKPFLLSSEHFQKDTVSDLPFLPQGLGEQATG